jgi:hypothetical protein
LYLFLHPLLYRLQYISSYHPSAQNLQKNPLLLFSISKETYLLNSDYSLMVALHYSNSNHLHRHWTMIIFYLIAFPLSSQEIDYHLILAILIVYFLNKMGVFSITVSIHYIQPLL